MSGKRVIAVNESSLVDLKAELYRKESQFRKEKVKDVGQKKTPIWQKKKSETKKGKKEKDLKDAEEENKYDKELEKSRLMLEAKSALYEKLSKGEIEVPSDEDEQDGRFLVDFHQKTIAKEREENDHHDSNENKEVPVKPDEEWVDYVDSFGRSKKCLRKDLPLMKEKDEISSVKDEKSKPPGTNTSFPTLLSDDMRREMIRKKWEKEVEEKLDKPVGPVHYEDVLFDETRDHGVGYYKFSTTEEERQEQQSLLKNFRTQTEQQRDKREKLLAKRKAVMDARLQKIKERKLRKLKEQGLVSNDDGETENQDDQTSAVVETEGTTHKDHDEVQLLTSTAKDENDIGITNMVERIRNESTRSDNPNKWEKTKVDLSKFEKPKPKPPSYNPQDERNPEFAPPTFYQATEPKTSQKRKWNFHQDIQDQTSTNIRTEEYEIQQDGSETTETQSLYNDTYTQSNIDSTSTYTPQGYADPSWSYTSPNTTPDPSWSYTSPNTNYYPPPHLGGVVPPYLPPPFPPPIPPGGFIPPNLPPPHTFPPPPYNFPPSQPNQPIPHLQPPLGGALPPNLPPPPTHAFPPPDHFPS